MIIHDDDAHCLCSKNADGNVELLLTTNIRQNEKNLKEMMMMDTYIEILIIRTQNKTIKMTKAETFLIG